MGKAKETFQKVTVTVKEKWSGLSKNARLVTLAVSVSVVVALIALIALSSRTNYDVLFTGVSESDMNEVTTILGLSGIDYSITDGGSTIKVESSALNEARMSLALAGYPRAGTDYSHWNESVGLFSTDFEKKEAKRQQLEIRIQDTLRMVKKVDNAVVTVTLPPEKSYAITPPNPEESQASVLLTLKPGEKLTKEEIEGIQTLVLSAVPGLTIERLGILDQNGMQLMPEDSSSLEAQLFIEKQTMDMQRQYQKAYERDLEDKVAVLLDGVVKGFTVSASATFDFSNWTNQSKVYTGSNIDPETGMQSGILEEREIKQALNGIVPDGGVPGTPLNADISPDYPTFIGDMEGEVYYELFEKTNYLVNENINQSTSNGAVLDSVSLAVQIDDVNLTQDEVDNWRFLLSRAINADIENVAVRAGSFNLPSPGHSAGGTVSPDRNVLVFIIISLGVLLIALFLLAIMSSGSKKRRLVRARAAMQGAGGTPAFADDGSFGSFRPTQDADDEESVIKIQPLTEDSGAETRETLLKNEIREFAQTNPEIVAQLIRTWLKE